MTISFLHFAGNTNTRRISSDHKRNEAGTSRRVINLKQKLFFSLKFFHCSDEDEEIMDTSADPITENPRNSTTAAHDAIINGESISTDDNPATVDEFNFDNYDEEDSAQVASIADVAAIDPDNNLEDQEDSEAEDDLIKPTDNLLIVGHIDDDAASLEVFGENNFFDIV